MSIIWTTHTPGDVGRMRVDELPGETHVDGSGGSAALISDGIPDWIRIPANSPSYAGEVRRVEAVAVEPCPADLGHCGREVYHLTLSGPGALRCACCSDHGFQIYRPAMPPGLDFDEGGP